MRGNGASRDIMRIVNERRRSNIWFQKKGRHRASDWSYLLPPVAAYGWLCLVTAKFKDSLEMILLKPSSRF